MEENKKRLFFTADEKVYIKELASRYKDVVENKKSDVVSVTMKKKKWQEIADEFNQNFQYTKRTAEQIKKCWENMKAKRKQELAQDKRQRMSTGGGPIPRPSTSGDPEMDSVFDNIDIEVNDVVDSDTLALVASTSTNETSYTLLEDGSLISRNSTEERSDETEQEESDGLQTRHEDRSTPLVTKNIRKVAVVKESDKRLERCDMLKEHDKELHSIRVREMEFKAKSAELEYEKKILELNQMKEKHAVEMEILKKKLQNNKN